MEKKEKKSVFDTLNHIQTTLNAPKGQYNAFGKYKYRSCEDILAAVKPLLKDTGATLTISDEIVAVASRIYIKATATLRVGDDVAQTTAYAREEETKKGMDASQVTGAASSYARKYALNGLFCIDDTKDADSLNISPEYTQQDNSAIIKEAIAKVKAAKTASEVKAIYAQYGSIQKEKEFYNIVVEYGKKLSAA